MTYTPLIPFSTINNMSASVKRSNITLVFLKLLAMVNLELKFFLQDQAPIFQDIYFNSSQIYQLTIMYRFEHTNHVLLNFLFQNLYNLFLRARNLHK